MSEWLKGMGLSINVEKSNAMVIGNTRLRSHFFGPQTPKITCNGTTIPYVNNLKYLGIYITPDLSWDKEVSATISKVHWGIRRLKGMQFKPGSKTKLILFKTLLQPTLDYCLVPCSDMSGEDIHRLQVAQNACVRYALRPGRMEHMTPYYYQHGILKIKERKILLMITLGNKIRINKVPRYIYINFSLLGKYHDINTRNAGKLFIIPPHCTSRMAGSFIVTFASQFNSLPSDIRDNPTKTKLQKYLLNRYSDTDHT